MNIRSSINSAWWRFLLPFSLQLAIILLVPAKSAYTYNFGKAAIIKTRPVDPYDLLRGYSQTLSYDISSTKNLKELPGGDDLTKGEVFYLVLEADSNLAQTPPLPWKAIKVTKEKPNNLADNQTVLKGKVNSYRSIKYGLERYYMPESQRNKINQEIRNLQRDSKGRRSFLVEIKVDRWGNSIPASLWIGKKNYRF